MASTGSEMRRAARALVERRPSRIASDYPVDESVRRIEDWSRGGATTLKLAAEASAESVAVRRVGEREAFYRGTWRAQDGAVSLEGEFSPGASALRVVKLCSFGIAALLALTAWAWLTQPELATKVSLTVLTVLCVLVFPYVALALSSQQSAREAAVTRAFERALRREGP